MIVSFEGLDGVGKTTIATKFSEEFGFKYIERPLYKLFDIKNYDTEKYKIACELENKVYNNTKSKELKACLTSLGLIYLHKIMNNEKIVIDRDLLSNYSFNGSEETEPLFEALLKMNIYPDIVFLLYASKDTRIKRIIKRDPNDKDLTDIDVISQNYEKIFDFIKKYNLPFILIDTENKTIDEVYNEIKQKYEEIIYENGNIKSSWQYRINK